MQIPEISKTVLQQKKCYQKGYTHNLQFRIRQLKILKKAIHKYQEEIIRSVYLDMGKPAFEAFTSEVRVTLSHLDLMLKNLPQWIKPVKLRLPIGHLPGSSFTLNEPYGVVLIMSPWNYPFQLAMVPLIGAIAAGNCAVLKPSEIAANTSHLIKKLVSECFDTNYVSVVEGGIEVGEQLLEQRWDFIFFTGSPQVGKKVMHAASQFLTPLILELGGKSPCLIDKHVNLEIAVRRIAQAKFFNAGQSCVAPDYILIHRDIKEQFIDLMKVTLTNFFGNYLEPVKDMARIVNQRHYNRLVELIDPAKVVIGGKYEAASNYISPTVLDRIDWEDAVMQEEIFGPILPLLEFDDLDKVLEKISNNKKPLSLFFFSNSKKNQDKVINMTRSGSLCINEALIHFIITQMPFGGVGDSGMGQYHGKASFEAFSHKKSILKKSLLFDVKERFPPYKISRRMAQILFKYLSG